MTIKMTRIRALLASTLLAACAVPLMAQVPPPPAPLPGDGPEDGKLKRIFHDSDEAGLKRNPIGALFRGDLRYADRLGDFFSYQQIDAERAAAQEDLRRLNTIDRARLTATDQIAYDVFRQGTMTSLKGLSPEIVALTAVRPLDHFNGVQGFYPDLASGQGAAPFKTLVDYENNLKRNAQYAAQLDIAILRFREGMKTGVVQPKLTVRNMIEQFDNIINEGVEKSTFMGPVKKFPDGISAADQARLRTAYATQVRDVLIPAHERMRDFLSGTYLAAARDSVGLSAMPGGAKLYDYLIEASTTLPLKAEEVHALGLSEVARILKEMETQKQGVGYKGTLPEFFEFLRTDKQFVPTSADDLRLRYEAIGKRVDARVREQFSLIPKTALEIRPVPAYKEKTDAGGSYQQGTPDGSRPGVFFYNTYDLPSRYMWEMETLYLHEAVPGHHFQISLAAENEKLPAFMRFGGNTAYVEGWALYAEQLADEMGMYEGDPLGQVGYLQSLLFRASRLVADSGLHHKRWSREQTIRYMVETLGDSETAVTTEVERYCVWPGQASSYKVGHTEWVRLREDAKAQLGDTFDLKGFHDVALSSGGMPLDVLKTVVGEWVAAKKA